ncbi:hypothetical protein BJX70DRAFT_201464 [Aspergillus crustosus]
MVRGKLRQTTGSWWREPKGTYREGRTELLAESSPAYQQRSIEHEIMASLEPDLRLNLRQRPATASRAALSKRKKTIMLCTVIITSCAVHSNFFITLYPLFHLHSHSTHLLSLI